MEKIEQNVIHPSQNIELGAQKIGVANTISRLQSKIEVLFFKKGVMLLFIGFLLGRALILSSLTPFALPYFASVYMMRRNKAPIALAGLLAGALTISIGNALYIFASCTVFLFAFRFIRQKNQNRTKGLPYYVLIISLFAKLLYLYVQQQVSTYDTIMAGMEASLSFILALIFLQSIPLLAFSKRKLTLKTEEVISVIILLA